jgi:hypothetical protein
MSAKLKMGKFKIFMFIKSLTPHKITLSIKLPVVPAINTAAISQCIFFVMNNQTNAQIPSILMVNIRIKGTGNDREIPLLSTGRINVVSFRYLKL